MNNLLLTVQYDGFDYSGWVIQNNSKTVQGELNKAIYSIVKKNNFKTLGASKTDAGVHANDQKVLFTYEFDINNLNKFKDALNKALPNDIKVKNINYIDHNFNIRNVKQKTYSYTINNSNQINPFKSRYELTWNYKEINIDELQTILNLFVGEHDFKLFSGLNDSELENIKTIRTIDSINVENINNKIIIFFKAKGFIRYQIRMIIGAALSAYRNKRISIDEIEEKLKGNGDKSPIVIEPYGLCLEQIIFSYCKINSLVYYIGEGMFKTMSHQLIYWYIYFVFGWS